MFARGDGYHPCTSPSGNLNGKMPYATPRAINQNRFTFKLCGNMLKRLKRVRGIMARFNQKLPGGQK